MTIANAKPDLLITGPIGTSMVNAASSAWHDYLTVEAKITAAIAYAVSIGAKYCYVPDSFLPYTASLVTFNPAVQMLREGQSVGSYYDIRAYGADPLGVLDATAAVQAAITGAQALNTSYGGSNLKGGTVYVPPGVYVISSTLTVTGNNITIRGEGFAMSAAPTAPPSLLTMPAGSVTNFNLLTVTNTLTFQLAQIGIQGNQQGTSQGVFGTGCQNHVYDHVFFNGFGGSAVQLTSIQDTMICCWAQNCLMGTPSVDTGVFDLSCTDMIAVGSFATASIAVSAGLIGTGRKYAWAIRSGNGGFFDCYGDQSHHGWLIASTALINRFVACRAFQNQGNGWNIAGNTNTFTGCMAIANSQTADNTYDGFLTSGFSNLITGCITNGQSGDARQQRHGFNENNSAGGNDADVTANRYSNNSVGANIRGQLYFQSGGNAARFEHPHRVSPDKGDASITVTPFVDADTILYQTPLTAPRTCTLAGGGVSYPKGSRMRIVRSATATGASTLTVSAFESKVLAVGQWVDFEIANNGQWVVVAFGSL